MYLSAPVGVCDLICLLFYFLLTKLENAYLTQSGVAALSAR